MKTDVTRVLIEEHGLILRMIALVEKNTGLLEDGRFDDWKFYLDAVDFIRNFADRFHHAKEEDVLFKALVDNGMPAQNSPVAAMLMAHDQGRDYVRGLETAAQKALAGEPGQTSAVVENARGYADLLRDHIDKEDNILYPLSERILPEEVRPAMVGGYRKAAAAAPGVEKRYRLMVEHYEGKLAA
jgi:hemerythrin-like domain-containing protein